MSEQTNYIIKTGPILLMAKGNPEDSPKYFHNPRIIQTVQNPNGVVEIQLHPMIGEPEVIEINTIDYCYLSNNTELNKLYNQETSPIKGLQLI